MSIVAEQGSTLLHLACSAVTADKETICVLLRTMNGRVDEQDAKVSSVVQPLIAYSPSTN